ncbi:MAG TPA: histidinol dehydrogenase [Vicinamibacterales bacterium]|nr:histidinol dehydrogenase [Vicinamibacterales bacterium]
MIRILKTSDTAAIDALVAQDATRDPKLVRAVARIVAGVRENGDEALVSYARRFDALTGPIEITPDEILAGAARVPRSVRRAIAAAARSLQRVSARQMPRSFTISTTRGVVIEQRVAPLERVGCYVPAGRYPLPSSLLMSAVPARVAGVREIIAVCPRPDDTVMAAAVEAGVTRMFRIGGAHAIAALAYGTATVPKVDRIAGPGSAYVAAAKTLVSADCPIDFTAGPSEIAVISDEGSADWIAADLVAQAEHDADARAVLVTTNRRLAAQVARSIEARLKELDDSGSPARVAMASHGAIVIARTRSEAVALMNRLAPEHAVCDDDETAALLSSAGTIFVGPWSAQAAGDYATGSNHILPTGGAARFRGGLSAADFVKITSVQRVSREGLRGIAPAALALAAAEGLVAHAASIRVRLGENA